MVLFSILNFTKKTLLLQTSITGINCQHIVLKSGVVIATTISEGIVSRVIFSLLNGFINCPIRISLSERERGQDGGRFFRGGDR